ncbi:type I restriction enzyme S subunit [Sinobaca qinghaiensis]|uniref:Type I restriction enzyme S subunit n=1 Tax=Sinobaca qinghaiensis TaxID=342944 RepID=A0A419V0A0_9BACL|nr:restriction endonuclease subunit S [Sinobaca qinghaiensis]RKD71384.1 type I restriction enzyme S subunit [Sinobaca qinghaiensis]
MTNSEKYITENFYALPVVPLEEQPFEIPESWKWVYLKDINSSKKRSINPTRDQEQIFELYSIPSFPTSKPEKTRGKDIKSNKQMISKNEILLSKINPRINRVWLVGEENEYPLIASTEWIVISNENFVEPKYLLYLLQSPYFRKLITKDVSGVGGSLTRAKPKLVENYPIALPPLKTQISIARKIEVLVEKIYQAKKLMEEAKSSFELRRAAIFDEFMENVNSSSIEILDDESIEYFFEQKENAKKWIITNFESIAAKDKYSIAIGPFGSDLKVTDYSTEGVPLIFVKNIRSSNYLLNRKYVSEKKAEKLNKHSVTSGDILVTKMGDPPGDVDLCPSNVTKAIITADCIKLKVNPALADNNFIKYVIESPIVKKQILKMSKGVAQQKISLSIFKKMTFSLPSLSKQKTIVEKLDKIIENENTCIENIKYFEGKIEVLQKSILSKAFKGQL